MSLENLTSMTPDASDLARHWHGMLDEARELVSMLPAAETGRCILDSDGKLFLGDKHSLGRAIGNGGLRFHSGSLHGALPGIRPTSS